MERSQRLATTVSREKLGLALAGGGFRASIFHLGVLRRMAELDVLRRVEVLSTVSGGSIVGALYFLLLKKELEAAEDGNLTRDQYVHLIDDLDRQLLRGIGKNLRTRMVMNPFGVLRVALTSQSLGQRMARMYERYLYAEVVADIKRQSVERGEKPEGWAQRLLRPGEFPLKDLRIHPGGASLDLGIEDYNRQALEAGRSVSTRLVLNATSLNSGARFWFSSVEVGDWYLGHFRHSQIDLLRKRKDWLDQSPAHLSRLRASTPADDVATSRALSMAEWWLSGRFDGPPPGGYWDRLFAVDGFPGRLLDTHPGLLRQAHLPAWYLSLGPTRNPPITGGLSPEAHWLALRDAMDRIDGYVAASVHSACEADEDLREQLLSFLVELYWIQSAGLMSMNISRFWDKVSVGDAVGASANFPPVFPPFPIMGLYDSLHVARMGLTDGGLFDNVGLTALEDEGCTQIIASDTGGLRTQMEFAPGGRLPMLGRIIEILQSVLGSTQREALRERRRVSRILEPLVHDDPDLRGFLISRALTDLAYFKIDSDPVDPRDAAADYPAPPPASTPGRRRLLAGIRTDLDAFSEQEVAALVNHGYSTADRYIRRYFKPRGEAGSFWTEAWNEPPEVPMAIRVDDATLDRTLKVSHARFLKGLTIGAPLSLLFTLGVAAAALWTIWPIQVSVGGTLDDLQAILVAALHAMAPWFRAAWTTRHVSLGLLLAVVVLVLVVIPWLLEALVVRWAGESSRKRRIARGVAAAAKWPRFLLGNVLWLFGLFPILVALSVSALAWISDLFFERPFLRATRNRR